MSRSFSTYLRSSVGQKQILALAAMGLMVFLLIHMVGNLLIFIGAEPYNKYSNALVSASFFYPAEVGLALLFVVHIGLAISVSWKNRQARPVAYHMVSKRADGSSVASRSMMITGVVTLIFLVIHVATLKYGAQYFVIYQGVQMRDLFRLMLEKFESPLYVLWYIVAMGTLCMHLWHGFASSFQSLGWNQPKYNPYIKNIGKVFAVVISLGFAVQAIYLYLLGGVNG